MQLRKIIAACILGLLIAFWEESLLAVYFTCLRCMLMYAFRMFSLSVPGRECATNDAGNVGPERPVTSSQLFAASLHLRRGELDRSIEARQRRSLSVLA